MKKSIYFIIACFIACTSVSAQTVFAPLGAKWHYYYEPDLTPVGDNYLKWEVEKDTIIEAKTCSKIVGKRISFDRSNDEYDTTVQTPIFTYTSGDTIYYYNNEFKRFTRFINLDAKVNDTLTLMVPYKLPLRTDTTFSIVVRKLDTVILDGEKLKRFQFETIDPVALFKLYVFIERIGSILDISPLGYTPAIRLPDQRVLRCYVDDKIDTNTYWVGDCDFINPLSISDPTFEQEIKVFPNPVKDIVEINTGTSTFSGEIALYNITTGTIAYRARVKNTTSTKVDVSHFASGVYFVSLIEDQTNTRINIKSPLIISKK